jgi:hypothetical protein
MLRQHADADGPRRQALQDRVPIEEPRDPRCADRSVAGQDPAEHPRLDLPLHQLSDHGGQQPAPPHPAEAPRRHHALPQWTGEEAGRRGGVLHGEIDAHTADG